MKNIKSFGLFESDEKRFVLNAAQPTSRQVNVTSDNIDTLTFKAYINRRNVIVETLPNIKKYADEHKLMWMWWYDNGYSVADESPSTYEKVRQGILKHTHGKTIYLSSSSEGLKHRSDS